MEVKVTFTYLNKTIEVLCRDNEQMNDLFKKFVNKLNDGSDITHYIYYSGGNKLGNNGTIAQNKYICNRKEINILVQKKLRIIKCPRCGCNDCIVNLDNYIASFYGCKYGHTYTSVCNDYINLQKIDSSELRCNESGCPNTQNNYIFGFYKCLTCSDIIGSSHYFCKDHDSNHENHVKVKFDKKNYYCVNHFKPFKKYCFTHKKDLCEDCEKEHANHKIRSYETMIPNIDELKESLKTMEKILIL